MSTELPIEQHLAFCAEDHDRLAEDIWTRRATAVVYVEYADEEPYCMEYYLGRYRGITPSIELAELSLRGRMELDPERQGV